MISWQSATELAEATGNAIKVFCRIIDCSLVKKVISWSNWRHGTLQDGEAAC